MRRRATPRSWTSPPPSGAGRRRERVTPTLAALSSALLPGAGQLLAGQRGQGAALAVGAAAVAGTAGWLMLDEGVTGLLAWVLEPGVLTAVLAVNVVVALVRGLVAADAWRAALDRFGRVHVSHAAGLVAVLALLVALPHAGVALAGIRTQQVIAELFVESSAPATARPTALEPAPAPPRGEPRDATTHRDPAAGLGGHVDDTGPPATPEFTAEPFDGTGRLTVLLLGSDAGPGRTGSRIDAKVVASVDLRTGGVVLVSIARNLGDVPLSGVFAERLGNPFPERLMALYAAAASDRVLREQFPDAGSAAHVEAAESLLGLRIDHVAYVDLAGFVDAVDALGGVEVDVAAPIHVRLSPPRDGEGWRAYDIPAGRQRLDGHAAHAYVRSRTGTDDYDRMRRQRCLLGALAGQADTRRLLRSLPRLADVLAERVRTDIPVERLPDLARIAGRVDVGEIRTLGLTPPAYTHGLTYHGFHRADVHRIQQAVRELILGHGHEPDGVRDLDGTCS